MKNDDNEEFNEPCIEGFNAVEWSRQVKRNIGKKYTNEKGLIDREKLKKDMEEFKKRRALKHDMPLAIFLPGLSCKRTKNMDFL